MSECRKIQTLFSEYIDHALDESMMQKVDMHLFECDACRDELNKLKKAIQYLKGLEKVKTPDNFLNKVNQKINDQRSVDNFLMKILKSPATRVPVTVCIMLLLVLTVLKRSEIKDSLELNKIKGQVFDQNKLSLKDHPFDFKKDEDSLGKKKMVAVNNLAKNLKSEISLKSRQVYTEEKEPAYFSSDKQVESRLISKVKLDRLDSYSGSVQEDLSAPVVAFEADSRVRAERKLVPVLMIDTVNIDDSLIVIEKILNIINIGIPQIKVQEYKPVILDEVKEYYSFVVLINKDKFVFLKQALEDKKISFSLDPDIGRVRDLPFKLKIILNKIKP